jgi:hypothetical protein
VFCNNRDFPKSMMPSLLKMLRRLVTILTSPSLRTHRPPSIRSSLMFAPPKALQSRLAAMILSSRVTFGDCSSRNRFGCPHSLDSKLTVAPSFPSWLDASTTLFSGSNGYDTSLESCSSSALCRAWATPFHPLAAPTAYEPDPFPRTLNA